MLLSGAASEWHTASLFAVAPYMEVFMCYSLVPLALPPCVDYHLEPHPSDESAHIGFTSADHVTSGSALASTKRTLEARAK